MSARNGWDAVCTRRNHRLRRNRPHPTPRRYARAAGRHTCGGPVCDPDPRAVAKTHEEFVRLGQPVPPNQPDVECLLRDFGDELDAALIATPNVYHCQQAVACLEAGLDVLIEKPMTMSVCQARKLIAVRDHTGKALVVAAHGTFSSERQTARTLIASGELGPVHLIHALVWENWLRSVGGAWRQEPGMSGGGFLFDAGVHMLHTVIDLGGDVDQVSALLNTANAPVDVNAAVIARLRSGTLASLGACGDSRAGSGGSDVRVFTSRAILRTSIWGQYLFIQRPDTAGLQKIECPPAQGPWRQFVAIRHGALANPCPAEVGLQVAALWEAICQSAESGGAPVKCAV